MRSHTFAPPLSEPPVSNITSPRASPSIASAMSHISVFETSS